MTHDHQSTTLQSLEPQAASSTRLQLIRVSGGAASVHPLPAAGRMSIGRAQDNDIVLDDPTISRQHAALHLGAQQLELEDLGGPAGTSVAGRKLGAGERVAIAPGQVVEIASAMLVVQRVAPTPERRRVWPHGYFEMRLHEECAKRATVFSLMIVRVDLEGDAEVVERALAVLLREQDVIARYSDAEYELLLPGTTKERALDLAGELSSRLDAASRAEISVAAFPRDGRTPDVLLARARGLSDGDGEGAIVEDRAMIDLYALAERVAQGRISVMITGETGVGKELLAELVHEKSPRAARPLVRINCGALTETLLDSELFGHEKGAFTGADRAKTGLIEAAHEGTLFLDEVGELPPATQVKLLRVLEQREVLRVGSVKPRPVDVRFVAATNRNLEEAIAKGTFREDLYFRLNGVTLNIPPLRERRAEIAKLAQRFVASAAKEQGEDTPLRISRRALELLERYAWPGNIRELRNVMERAVLLCTTEVIEDVHLPIEKMQATWLGRGAAEAVDPPPIDLSPKQLEDRARVIEVLEACAGNQTRAAKMLGVSRRTLVKKIIRYQLPRPRMSSAED